VSVVNIYAAKTQLSRLVDQAAAGEDVIIARSGKPVARLTKLEPTRPKIQFGVLKGKVKVAKDFDAPLPETIRAAFESD
jgi:prevent-host-death family protein